MHPVHSAALTDVSSVSSLLASLHSVMASPESAMTVSSCVLGVAPETMNVILTSVDWPAGRFAPEQVTVPPTMPPQVKPCEALAPTNVSPVMLSITEVMSNAPLPLVAALVTLNV